MKAGKSVYFIAIARVTAASVCRQVVVHLRVQCAFRKRLLQRIQQAALLKGGAGSASGQKLVQKLVRYRRFFAS